MKALMKQLSLSSEAYNIKVTFRTLVQGLTDWQLGVNGIEASHYKTQFQAPVNWEDVIELEQRWANYQHLVMGWKTVFSLFRLTILC